MTEKCTAKWQTTDVLSMTDVSLRRVGNAMLKLSKRNKLHKLSSCSSPKSKSLQHSLNITIKLFVAAEAKDVRFCNLGSRY
jgi:hypothetical protein